MGKKLTTQEFIERAKSVHGEKYDYSEVNYIDMNTRVKIICQEHGEFWQTPINHLNKHNCPKCINKYRIDKRKLSTDEFIQKSNKIHNNKYDYSKVNYINNRTKVCIICKEHGEFWQTPGNHLSGADCIKCAYEKQRLSNLEFLKKCKSLYDYDFSQTIYEKSSIKVKVICKKHGMFIQHPHHLLNGHGCPKCAFEIRNENQKYSNEEFINKCLLKHNNKYDYSKVEYKSCNDKVCIICPKHGEFWQNACSHLMGQGCPKCKSSHGENKIRIFLQNHNIEIEEQKIFEDCIYENKLKFDFYIPSKNLCIEYDGVQHFEPCDFSGNLTDNEIIKEFEILKKRDEIKNNYCKDNNIDLLRIPYTEFNNIENILNEYLNLR